MSGAARAGERDARGERDRRDRRERRRRRAREQSVGAPVPEPKDLVSGAGQPLDPGVRRELEERFGHDLGHVRLHTDRDAGALTDLLGADAVAVGSDIFFREGAYQPGTGPGRHLLAHEVLHTVQNPHGLGALRAGREPGAVSLPHQPAEREAEAAANEALSGGGSAGTATASGATTASGSGTRDAAVAVAGPHASGTDSAPRTHQTPGWLRYATVDADRMRTEQLDPATLTERLASGILRSLRGDPSDHSGRVRQQLARMAPVVRDHVLERLEVRLLTHEHDRLVELAEEEAGRLPLEDDASDVPRAVPDVWDELSRQRDSAPAEHEGTPAEHEGTPDEDSAADRAAEDGNDRRDGAPDTAGRDTGGAGAGSSAGQARSGGGAAGERDDDTAARDERQRQEQRQTEQDAAADEASDERDIQEEQEDDEQQAVRDDEAEETEEAEDDRAAREDESADELRDESVDEGREEETSGRDDAPEDAAEEDDEREADEEPGPEERPLGLDPGADSDTGDSVDDDTAPDTEEDSESAWNTELQPDDFLPDEDLDLSGVPTADQLSPGSDAEPPVPAFAEPPATRAEQVEAEREREAVDDPGADAESEAEERADRSGDDEQEAAPPESAEDPESDLTARDLRTERPLDQEVGPDPEHDDTDGVDAESARRPDTEDDAPGTADDRADSDADAHADDGAGADAGDGAPGSSSADGPQAERTSEGAAGDTDSPAHEPDTPVPEGARTATERAAALGGEGTARLGSGEPEAGAPETEGPGSPEEPAREEPTERAATTRAAEGRDGTAGDPAGTGVDPAGDSHTESAAPASAPAVEADDTPSDARPETDDDTAETHRPAAGESEETDTAAAADENPTAASASGATRAAAAPTSGASGGGGTGGGGAGGGGGGGSAGPGAAPREERPPDLAGLDPEAGLSTAAGLKPHTALAAMDGVDTAVDTDVGAEEQALRDSPPTAERPAGAPQTLHGDPEAAAPGEYSDGEVDESDAPDADDAEVENSEEPEGDFPADDFELSTGDQILAGGAQIVGGAVNGVSNFFGGGDVIDTEALVSQILDLPTEDEAMEAAQVGTAEDVEMGEETGEASQEQTDALDETDAELHAEGVEDSRQPMGEDQVYPDVPDETLSGTVPGGQEHGDEGGTGATTSWEAPPEAVSEVAEHEQPGELGAAFQQGQRDMAEERETRDTDFRESQHEHEQRVQDGIDDNSRAQAEERERTRDEVTASREEWREEQDRELEEIDEEKGDEYEAVLEEVEEKEEETDEDVEEKEEEDDEAIREENEEGVEEATEERDREGEQSGNWLTRGVEWIIEKFEEIKQRIISILQSARDAVIRLIQDFAETVVAWIEQARQWIVERFQEFVQALVDLAQRFLSALREIATRVRDLIIRIRDAAIALVNQLATALRDLVTGLLDTIADTLRGVLDTLMRGLRKAVELVTAAVNAVMDFAMGLLNALGEWMDIAVDILADPGGWVGNAASSAETGAREHLVDEAQSQIKEWFNQKIQEILGLPQATFDLLLNGGMTKEEIVAEAWAAVLPQLPLIIGELVITKVVAKLIPGPGWALAVVEAIRAAFGALSEILRAFGLFMTYLKSVRGGDAAQPFAASVAAGIVALIEIVYQLLLSGIARYVEKVGSRLKNVAKGLKNRSPNQPDTAERRDQGEEVNAAQRESQRAEEELSTSQSDTAATPAGAAPTGGSGGGGSGGGSASAGATRTTASGGGGSSSGGSSTTTTKTTTGSGSSSSPGGSSGSSSGASPRRRTGAARDTVRRRPPDNRPGGRNDPNGPGGGVPASTRRGDDDSADSGRRDDTDTDTGSGGPRDRTNDQDGSTGQRSDTDSGGSGRHRREVDGPKRTPNRNRESTAGTAQRRARQTVRSALNRNRRAQRSLGRRNRNSPLGRAMRARSARLRTAFRNRRDQLRRHQQQRHQQRQQRRDQRQKNEKSQESKAARLRRIVARIRPRIDRMLARGVPLAALRTALRGMRLFYRLSGLDDRGGRRFTVRARLNPEEDVAPGLRMEMLDLAEALDVMARRLQQLESGHQRTVPLQQGSGNTLPSRDVPAGTSTYSLASDIRGNSKIPHQAQQMVNFSPENVLLGLEGGAGKYPGNITAHNFSPESGKFGRPPTYPQLSKGPLARDPQRAGQLARDLMTGKRDSGAWQGSGSRQDQIFKRRAAISGLLLGGVEPARLQSSFIPNLMGASLGAQGAVNYAEVLPDLPMSPTRRVSQARQQEFALTAHRILQNGSGHVPMPLLSGESPSASIPGVNEPQVERLRAVAHGLGVDNPEARRSLGVDMQRGSDQQTWSEVQRGLSNQSLSPTLSTGAEALMRSKMQVIHAWAQNQKMSFRDERAQKSKERELLDKIWRWLLSELDLNDGGKGF